MFSFTYICPSTLFFLIGLILFLSLMSKGANVGAIRRHLFHYILLAVLINMVAILAYAGLLAMEGSVQIGAAQPYSFPQDLIAKGWGALPELLILLFGVGLTVFFAVYEARKTRQAV